MQRKSIFPLPDLFIFFAHLLNYITYMVQIITQIFMYLLWLSLLNIKIYFADLKYENMKKNLRTQEEGKYFFTALHFI